MDEAAAFVALQNRGEVAAPHVTREHVAAVVTRWTGIPQSLALRIASQAAARFGSAAFPTRRRPRPRHRAPCPRRCAAARAGLHDPRKPLGSFLFRGPSGVGKTELAKALAEALFGSEAALVRIDLSEFTEAQLDLAPARRAAGLRRARRAGTADRAGTASALLRRAVRRARKSAPRRRRDPAADPRRRPRHRCQGAHDRLPPRARSCSRRTWKTTRCRSRCDPN